MLMTIHSNDDQGDDNGDGREDACWGDDDDGYDDVGHRLRASNLY